MDKIENMDKTGSPCVRKALLYESRWECEVRDLRTLLRDRPESLESAALGRASPVDSTIRVRRRWLFHFSQLDREKAILPLLVEELRAHSRNLVLKLSMPLVPELAYEQNYPGSKKM
ncbi:MAG: hypothetical protein QXU75_08365 [Candidatus Methanomethylicaceae archaeon]